MGTFFFTGVTERRILQVLRKGTNCVVEKLILTPRVYSAPPQACSLARRPRGHHALKYECSRFKEGGSVRWHHDHDNEVGRVTHRPLCFQPRGLKSKRTFLYRRRHCSLHVFSFHLYHRADRTL